MNNVTLIAFGFCWMVVAALLGLYLGAKHVSHLGDLGKAAARGDLASYHQTFEAYKWRSSIHAHSMLFSLSAVAVGAVLPLAGLSVTAMERLVVVLILVTVIWTLAALRRIRPVMGVADITFLGAMATLGWSMAGTL
jgi:hypothetical protein